MIQPKFLRSLDLEIVPGTGGARHLAAGSGLVAVGDFLYIVADDELHLGCFERSSDAAGRLLRLFPGELPSGHVERKAAKPDLEALVLLPTFANYPHGALLAVPSGSTPQRCRGVLLRLNAQGAVIDTAQELDFSGLYIALAAQIPALNIEGAVVFDDALMLLHRGSRTHPLSALIDVPLKDVHDAVAMQTSINALSEHRLRWVDLGTIEGVALAITDGASLPDGRVLVSAVAEQSADSYADGPCLGAAIAVLDREGRVLQLHQLPPRFKIEGVQAWIEQGLIRVLLVTDADDENIASCLLEVELTTAAQVNAAVDR